MIPSEIHRRAANACRRKVKLYPEDVGSRYGDKRMFPDTKDLNTYICPVCSFIHFGHTPVWEMTSQERKHVRDVRVQRARRKAHLITPSWMNDPRGFVQKMDRKAI